MGQVSAAVARRRKTFGAAATIAGAAVVFARPELAGAALVFDNISAYENGATGAAIAATGSTPNTFMGDGYTLAAGTADLTGFDLIPVNLSGTTFTALRATVYIYGTVNTTGTVSATTPAFSNLLGTFTVNLSGGTAGFPSGSFFPFETGEPGTTPAITFTTPLVIPNTTIGVAYNYQGTTDGTTFNSVNSLTSLITDGVPPTVGANVFNGYYRNANSETNGNFTSSLRALGGTPAPTNQSLAVRFFGDVVAVPEPASAGLLTVVAAGGLIRRRRRPCTVA